MVATGTTRWGKTWPMLGIGLVALSCGWKKSPAPEQTPAGASKALTASLWPTGAVTATNSVFLQTSARVDGDVAVTQASPGPVLSSNAELALATSARINGNAQADTLSLGTSSTITGSAAYNTRSGSGTVGGAVTSPLTMPLPVAIPALPVVLPGTTAIAVPSGQTNTLAAGAYGDVTLANGSTTKLALSGVYHLASLTVNTSARVECSGPCEIRISGRLSMQTGSVLGPAAGSGLGAGDVQVFVASGNASSEPNATPAAVQTETGAALSAYILAPNGTVRCNTSSILSGKLVGRDVFLGSSVVLTGQQLPIITQQPQPASLPIGGNATFAVVALGEGLSYQWLRNGVVIADATGASYTLANVMAADAGALFSVRITNVAGTVTSEAAVLMIAGSGCLPTDTTCNGVDDDCNGLVDDGYVAGATQCGIGACARTGAQSCVNGAVQSTCVAGPPAATDDTCNGVDDNCNGTVDEACAGPWPSEAVTATNSVFLQTSARIVGDVAVTQASPGPVLSSNAELALATSARITGNAQADTLSLGTSTVITGNAGYNGRSGNGTISGAVTSPLALPLAIVLPQLPAISPGTTTVSVASGQTNTLPAGAYAAVTVASGSTTKLVLSGIYHMTSLAVSTSARVECSGPCELRISGRLSMQTGSFLGPAASLGVGAGNVQVFIAGSNATSAPTSTPAAVQTETGAIIQAYVLAPNGTVRCNTSSVVSGKVIARDVYLGTSTVLTGQQLPIITQQPQAANAAPGGSATFTVVATGQDLSYQWLRDGMAIGGATAASYTLANVTAADNGALFSVRITNVAGTVTSNTALLTACYATDTDCDGVDDDCNGQVDDGYVPPPTQCGVGACARTGVQACVNGAVQNTCMAGEPAATDETCNGIDDDCNGAADEGYVPQPTTCGLGACQQAGTLECQDALLVPQCTPGTPAPADETCNGIDEDCDGQSDQGYVSRATSCGVGACSGSGTTSCVAGGEVDSCHAGTPAPNDTTCNGTDDDCDGGTDEDFVAQATTCGVGACTAHGSRTCVNGQLSDSCQPVQPPVSMDTSCNGVDDDCDGQADEDYVPTSLSCGVGTCAATGATACVGGQVTQNCQPGSPAGSDGDCNGADDNCNGSIDEGFVPHCAGTAIERCSSGALTHQECLDTNPCNGEEGCVGASCRAGTPPNLSDDNPCTADSCDPVTGIVHNPIAAGAACGTGRGCDGQGNCIAKPQIAQQPQDVTVAPGQTAVFVVVATGDSLAYQWRRLGQPISGATDASYTKSAAVADEGLEYSVVISNAAGSVTSRSAVLKISDSEGPTVTVTGDAARTVTTDMVTLTGTALDNGAGVVAVVVQSDRFQGEVAGLLSASTGAFSIEVPLSTGVNQLKVIARDAKGNATQQPVVVTFTVSTMPILTITEPASGARITAETVDVRGTVRSSLPASQIRLVLGDRLQFPTGTNGDYGFVFTGVRLVSGSNAITVRAETPAGVVTAQVVVSQGAAGGDTANAPAIRVSGAQADLFVTNPTLRVNGTVDAVRCVSSVTVNGTPATITGVGASISFERILTLPADGTAQPIVVQATDCDGRTASVSYKATYDAQAPQMNVGLSPAPAVHTVTATPFALTGTIVEPNLAGFTIGEQSIGLLPGSNGTWDFNVSLPLTRAVDTPFNLVAWDRAGNKATYAIIFRLDVALDIEVIAPAANAEYSSVDAQVAVSAVARSIGLPLNQLITAHVDANPPGLLARAGDTFTGSFSVATSGGGTHQMVFEVRDLGGAVLLTKSVPFSVKSANDIPLEATLKVPLNESQNVEAEQVISITFNRPIDPAKFTLDVRETVRGKQYVKSGLGPAKQQVELEDVVRDNEVLPGSLSFLPGDQLVAFYPARDFAYAATIRITGTYDGREVVRGTFQIRPLPTLMAGFVADQFANPLAGIKVTISGPTTQTVATNQFGAFSFGYGDYSASIPSGHYLLSVNPGLAERRQGMAMRYVDAYPGMYTDLGIVTSPLLSPSEPFRSVSSGDPMVRLAGGALVLDLSQASVEFVGGVASQDVHTEVLWRSSISNRGLGFAEPILAYALQPMGIGVTGTVGVDFEMPAPFNTDTMVTALRDWVLVSGLDAKSLQFVPAGVAKVDRTTRRARTEAPLILSRLDFIGVTPMPNAEAQNLLARYAAGEIGLDQLTSSLTALR